ncbi:MAG: lipid A export permease/ATP-binding protein MsbA [Pseudoxanthomonas suwonensis]|nr:lipid A export permease/ATP-binding protein MsbA [Pseudoxanthomonas suwonensis]
MATAVDGAAGSVYRRLVRLAAPYRGVLAIAIIAMLLEAAAGAAFVKLMEPVVDETFISADSRMAVVLPLVIIGLFLLRGLAGYIADMGMARAARSIARDLRTGVFAKYLRLPGLRFDSEPVPSMLVKLGSDSDQVSQAAVDAAKVMLQQSLQIIGALAVMLWTSWRVTLAVFVLGPPLGWLMGKVARRHRRIGHRIQESSAELMHAADETLSGQQEVKVYGAQAGQRARYDALAEKNLKLALKVESTRSLSSAVVQWMGAFGLALLLFFAAREAQADRLTAGGFVALMMAMMAVIPALKQLTNVQGMLQRGVASAQRLFAVLDAPDERDEGRQPLARARGELVFDNVSARYPGQEQPALDAVSFSARPGTVTAIVGRSGGGKSTLIKLIPRFYEPEAGRILLDGHPLDAYPLSDLRRQIALVGQRVALVDGSVADNVAFGELGDVDADALAAAIADANAAEFVERLAEGVHTPVGADGGRLSGGQRQRLAIARAILKDAPILILDEATAALDNESERLVQQALERLMPERTTLVIAHRLSTIEHADQVLVLDEGRLVEQGTHAELLAHDGLYAHLYRSQFRDPGVA